MSLKTSISLSASNLLTKKKRTFITSLACSIGIIGISVILSVSNGINSYVNNVQQNSTSSNYLMINNTQSTFNFNQDEKVELPEYPENIDEVYIYEESKNVTTTKQYLNENYINYLEKNIHGNTKETDLTLGIQYTKSVGINLISYNNEYKIVKTSNWNEILNNNEFMKTQYDVLIGDNLAKEYNEVSLVLDTYNRISSTTLDELGISYDDSNKIRYKDLIGKEFKLIKNDDYYKKQDLGNNKSIFVTASSKDELENAYNNGISLKIVSIVRQNKNATNSWISSGIAYTEELTNKILELNEDSEVVKYQKENKDYNVLTGKSFNSESSSTSDFPSTSNETYESNLVKLGGESTPSSITIYPKDFDSKEKIIKILDSWNESEIYKIYGNEKDSNGNFIADTYKVTYDDFSTIIVSMLSDLINIITYALVAFSSISLIVSGIMIAIITYASVIERTKEIGTIRSLGGRKKMYLQFLLQKLVL